MAGIASPAVHEVILRERSLSSTDRYFLGIDPSISNTGVVLLDGTGAFVDAVNGKDFIGRVKGFERYGNQVRGIIAWVKERVQSTPVYCGYEDYSFGSPHRAFDLAEYGGVLKGALHWDLKVQDLHLIAPTAAKLFATGRGTATKDMVQDAVIQEAPELEGCSSDVADAFSLARFASFIHGVTAGGRTLLRKRLDVVKAYMQKHGRR